MCKLFQKKHFPLVVNGLTINFLCKNQKRHINNYLVSQSTLCQEVSLFITYVFFLLSAGFETIYYMQPLENSLPRVGRIITSWVYVLMCHHSEFLCCVITESVMVFNLEVGQPLLNRVETSASYLNVGGRICVVISISSFFPTYLSAASIAYSGFIMSSGRAHEAHAERRCSHLP